MTPPEMPSQPSNPERPSNHPERGRVTPLDILFVLFVSGFVLLLMLWLAFTLLGAGERLDVLPPWIEQVAGSVWGWLTAGGSAILIGWLNRRGSGDAPGPSFSILIPVTTLGLAVSVIGLALVLQAFFVEPTNSANNGSSDEGSASPSTEKSQLNFALDLPEMAQGVLSKDTVAFRQQAPRLSPLRYSAMQPDQRFHEEIDVPPSGNTFVGTVKQKVLGSIIGQLPPTLTICLQRSETPPPTAPPQTHLRCSFAEGCSAAPEDEGWLSVCNVGLGVLDGLLGWFPAAYADAPAPSGWVVPSLETLKAKTYARGTGYSVFVGELQLNSIPQADRYRYRVTVNGTPIYFDGFQPDELTVPYDGERGLEIKFGLENLNFKGMHKGTDRIDLSIEFLQGQTQVKRYDLEMPHVALRSAAKPRTHEVGDATFTWKSRYWPAEQEFEYETFVGSTIDPRGAETIRKRIDQCGLQFEGRRVFGVVRPPLGSNPSYGITVGLENAFGQIEFTFSKDEEARLRSWVKEQAGDGVCRGGLRKDAYRYRIGSK